MKWIITTTAQVRRRYQIEAPTREDAERIACFESVGFVVEEEDIGEDVDSVEPKPEQAA